MAVRVVRPNEWKEADLVEVESDAPDNFTAIEQIDSWASEHKMFRTNEHWLGAAILPSGLRVFRAVCYRPTTDQIEAIARSTTDRETIAFAGMND